MTSIHKWWLKTDVETHLWKMYFRKMYWLFKLALTFLIYILHCFSTLFTLFYTLCCVTSRSSLSLVVSGVSENSVTMCSHLVSVCYFRNRKIPRLVSSFTQISGLWSFWTQTLPTMAIIFDYVVYVETSLFHLATNIMGCSFKNSLMVRENWPEPSTSLLARIKYKDNFV